MSIKNSRFTILGEHGSYIVKDIKTNTFVAVNIKTMESAERILHIFETDSKEEH